MSRKSFDDTNKEILDVIIQYIKEHGYPPTVREIGAAMGFTSSSSVQCHLEDMLEEGMIESDAAPGSPRAIRVPGYEFTKVKTKKEKKNESNIP